MGGLIKSEFRKIFSTNLWWGLLIPAALITMGTSWFGAALGSIGLQVKAIDEAIPVALILFAYGFNFATIFAAIYGVTAIAGEVRHKTITTTFLTANSRGAAMGAKMAAFAGIGAIYGAVNAVFGTIGALLGAGAAGFPSIGPWLALCLVSVLSTVLWTLLGVGLGALITSQVGAVLTLVLYVLVVETAVIAALNTNNATGVQPYLPNASGSFMNLGLAVDLFRQNLPAGLSNSAASKQFSVIADQFGTQWWISALVFTGYVALFSVLGWLASRQRDVT